ncbi:MAG: HD domain-containing protein [Candidatus Methylomirabilales bacterium]
MDQRLSRSLLTCQNHPLVRQMAIVAAEQGLSPVYLVGGFLRDTLLERPGALDIDLVSTNPAALGAALRERFAGRGVCLGDQTHRVVFRWKGDRVQVDISPLRRGDIVEDLRGRDFTINALAVPLGEDPPRVIDPAAALQDIAEGRVRVSHPRVLTEDPIRLLRGIRLAAQLDFTIDEATTQAIRRWAPLLSGVAPERLREEFFKMLDCSEAGRWLAVMDDLTLLEALLPETRPMRGCLQDPPHRYDVFTHSLETVRSLDRVLRELPRFLPLEAASLSGPLRVEVEGGISRQSLLCFAALLHDVGKPGTRSTEGGRVRFLGHASSGALVAEEICHRLRLGSRATAMTVTLIREHLRPLSLRQAEITTPRARYRFWRDVGAVTADLLLLSIADVHATWGQMGTDFRRHLRFVREMFAFYRERIGPTGPQKLVDGHELMDRLHLRPGPFIGFLLERIREEASLGAFRTKEEVFRYLKRRLQSLQEEFTQSESP